jgi:predicted translin family RNA/ssDNA-binding protein
MLVYQNLKRDVKLIGVEYSRYKGNISPLPTHIIYSPISLHLLRLISDSVVLRLRTPGPLPPATLKDIAPHHTRIQSLFQSVLPDLQGLNGHRYARQISGGIQEFIEAVSFQHYIETGLLISYDEARGKLPAGVMLTEEDYSGGLFDLGGEMMRFAVTGLATGARGGGYGDRKGHVLGDMRELRMLFERLDFRSEGDYGNKERERKMEVLRQSVEKVEVAVYGLVVRGSERPEGWVPDLEVSGGREIGVE